MAKRVAKQKTGEDEAKATEAKATEAKATEAEETQVEETEYEEVVEEIEVEEGAAPPEPLWTWGTGRRKTSVARVRIRPGAGEFLVNKRKLDEYFPTARLRVHAFEPLKVTRLDGRVDVFVNVKGGGTTGQAGAILMGLARALAKYDPNSESVLRSAGHMTRDARMVERKKYGQRGARRKFQYSKR